MSDTPKTDLGRPITIDDIKHEATGVKDLAISETKRVGREAISDNVVRTVIIGVAAVVALTSLAYFMGRRVPGPPPPPWCPPGCRPE